MSQAPAAPPHAPVHRDYLGAKMGMWLFLFTEILLFGGLFILYSAYRFKYGADFHEGGQHLNFVIGVINTVVLLTSSLTMALSIAAIGRGRKGLSVACLSATILLGAAFLVNKAIEWSLEISHGIYPSASAPTPEFKALPQGEQLFFGLYYAMTGLHGLHVIAGMTVLAVMLVLLVKDRIRKDDFVKLENSGLYWHLVDVIWIFLLPLFYLAA